MIVAHAFIAVSLDGYIARPDGGIDWLDAGPPAPDGEDFGYADFMSKMDGLVMGRASFEVVSGFSDWPYEKPVVVLSSTLSKQDIPTALQSRVKLMFGAPPEILADLAAAGWTNAYIDGGVTIQRFLKAGCLDELIVTRLPVLIGAGLPLFGPVDTDQWIEHIATRSFANGLVQSHYRLPRTAN